MRQAEEPEFIVVRGAREHNLQIDELAIPKKQLVVFTGVSGSGKSSLAFDTLYAEGQRRYVESLSSYARQFLGQMEKPKYESIRGLSPTIAIEQKTASSNPRSTVGTITEIYDYLRVLYARAGEQRCHLCGTVVAGRSAAEIVDELLGLPAGTKIQLLAPMLANRKGEHRDLLADARKRGFVRARINGQMVRLEDAPPLDKKKRNTLELVVDRVTVRSEDRARITDSVESALKEGAGQLIVLRSGTQGEEETPYSEHRACPRCGIGFPELSPQSFSFNSPLGMCPDCTGLGIRLGMDPELVVPNAELTIEEGAVEPWASSLTRGEGWVVNLVRAVRDDLGVPLDVPWKKLTPKQRSMVLYGAGSKRVRVQWGDDEDGSFFNIRFEGILNSLMRRYQQTGSEQMKARYERYLSESPCRACDGQRLRPESRSVLVAGRSIVEVSRMTVAEATGHFGTLRLPGSRALVAEELLKEINARLGFLMNVGLEYLSLARTATTLSGGEAQRIRLASQLGSELSGVMYVLDEPSIGLHARDNSRLITTLKRLRDLGNTVIVVEHDEEAIESADFVCDFGPGAGRKGGKLVFAGSPDDLRHAPTSLTGAYLAGRERIDLPPARREPAGWLTLRGCAENNLKEIDVRFPLGVLCAVTGVSGAGKSSLIAGTLYPALRRRLYDAYDRVGRNAGIEGIEQLDKVINIDQSPIGRTPRSNPATYTKAFDLVRELYTNTPEAKAYGYKPGRFSFNVKGGRCEACEGDGQKRVEMHFLPDVFVPCEVCRGKRYNDATLRVKVKDRSIAEMLDTTVEEAVGLFANHPGLAHILGTLLDVGLGYVALGQPAPTLSGGEAQRVKLAKELARRETGRTIYILDEPTTGLHFDDVRRLLSVLQRLVDAGNTVLVIEHNLDVVRCADHVLDLGPEGGAGGGEIVAQGTPEEIASVEGSYTGEALRPLLGVPTRRVARRA